eukprot:365546-Chlamydomonas_euryale.AAC.3
MKAVREPHVKASIQYRRRTTKRIAFAVRLLLEVLPKRNQEAPQTVDLYKRCLTQWPRKRIVQLKFGNGQGVPAYIKMNMSQPL